METIKMDILNPKSKALLTDLANLDLILFGKVTPGFSWGEKLAKFRKNADKAPSLEEIDWWLMV